MKRQNRRNHIPAIRPCAGALMAFILFFPGFGCHPCHPRPPQILVQTTPENPHVSPNTIDTDPAGDTLGDSSRNTDDAGDFELLVQRDAHFARDILLSGLRSTEDHLSAWSAVYLQLPGAKADAGDVRSALLRGVESDNPLLQALCLRWLVRDEATLPVSDSEFSEPVAQLFFALGLLARDPAASPDVVRDALLVGNASQFHSEKIPLNSLLFETAPYDNGPLALAIAFVNARRMEIANMVSDVKVPLSAQYRQLLLKRFQLTPPQDDMAAQEAPSSRFTFTGTGLHSFLENPLNGQPLPTLRNVIMTADGSLRINALRSMAATSLAPEVADFAATATALHSDDEQTRIEAARTYLLLVARATGED